MNSLSRPCVAQVVLSFGRGGLETMAVGLAGALAKRGLRSVIIALDEGGELEPVLDAAGVESYVLGGRKLRDPRYHWRLARLLRHIRPDVVHSHNFAAFLHTAVARRLAFVPRMVHTEHAFEYLTERRLHLWIRRASRGCNAFVVVGERVLPFFRDVVGVAPERLRVIPNGVDLTAFQRRANTGEVRRDLGLPEATFLVGTAGRLAPEKDLATLVRAVDEVRRERDDLHLVFVGEGVERPALEAQVSRLGLSERVRFLGWRRDVGRVVSAFDLFVLSSENEGLPLAVLEAMALGVPVASTPVGDLPVVVEDGVSGRLFPVGDSTALAHVIRDLARDELKRRALGAAGRAVVERRYDHAVMVDGYLDAYGISGFARGGVAVAADELQQACCDTATL
ncbi:MAG TPA: glycosyltransferase [Gemmatimonadaceae bacterium]|nr:glycosyltransferase [Gemmatimonadaceae bacterium]